MGNGGFEGVEGADCVDVDYGFEGVGGEAGEGRDEVSCCASAVQIISFFLLMQS